MTDNTTPQVITQDTIPTFQNFLRKAQMEEKTTSDCRTQMDFEK